MSQASRPPGRPNDGPLSGRAEESQGGGSVKRARQRVEAELLSEQPRHIHDPTLKGTKTPVNHVPQFAAAPIDRTRSPQYQSRRQHQTAGLRGAPAENSNLPPIGAAISYPTPISQWPLQKEDGSPRKRNNSPIDQRSVRKGPPPQRPPRPSYVPSIFDASNVQEPAPSLQYHGPQRLPNNAQYPPQQQSHYWQDPYQLSSSQGSRSLGAVTSATSSNSSRPSTSSSADSIPASPVPSIPPLPPQQQLRRSANLGPPPSSRRGASSYYSQASYVAPIPEELPESVQQHSHGSFASSHVIPTSWGDGSPGCYMGEGAGDEEDEDLPEGEDGRQSRGTDHDESTGLVRQASLGQRRKPSLTTIKGNDNLEGAEPGRDRFSDWTKDGKSRPNLVGRAAIVAGAAGGTFAAGTGGLKSREQIWLDGSSNGGTGMYDESSSSSDASSIMVPKPLVLNVPANVPSSRSRSPAGSPVDPEAHQTLGGGSNDAASPLASTASGSERGVKRPPPLNLDAVREADTPSRGSTTSLPDLIKRATRLASNLDRGKTASRIGMLDMFGASDTNGRSSSGSISDILASFPPPGLTTPTTGGERPTSCWPSPLANSNLALAKNPSPTMSVSGFDEKKRPRRCCGMPAWAFILLLIILALLIAAAIVIPVILIVLPRQHASTALAKAAADLSNCRQSTPCANGGTSIVAANSCRCICSNGFTGATCSITADNGCTTMNIRSDDQDGASFTNATLGSSIPRLLSGAVSNFSIPLNSSALLSLFSATNLSCTSENALVTFNGKSQRRELHLPFPLPEVNLIKAVNTATATAASESSGQCCLPRDIPTLAPTIQSLDGIAGPTATDEAFTSNGIIFAAPSATDAIPSSIITASPSVPSSSPSNNQSNEVTSRDLDFARVVVLLVFQETELDTAVVAQEKLQYFLIRGAFNESTVDVGAGVVADFGREMVILGNGMRVGGKGTR